MLARAIYRIKQGLAASGLLRRVASAVWPAGRQATIREGPLVGVVLYVPPFCGGTHYSSGAYEQVEAQILLELVLRSGSDWFADVGAHVGYYSLLVDRARQGECTVHAFEPAAAGFSCLARNLAHNCAGRFRIYNEAVAQASGRQLFCGASGAVSSGLQAFRPGTWGKGGGHRQLVRTVSLDEALGTQASPRRGVVKVDVEGAEVAVLSGASTLMREQRPSWLIECHSPDTEHEAVKVMHENHYVCYWVGRMSPGVVFPHLLAVPEDAKDLLGLAEELAASGAVRRVGSGCAGSARPASRPGPSERTHASST